MVGGLVAKDTGQAIIDSTNGFASGSQAIRTARKGRLVKDLTAIADSTVQQYANQQRKLGAKGYS